MVIFQGEFFLPDCMAFMRNDLTIRSFSYAKNNILQILNIFGYMKHATENKLQQL